MKSLFKLSLIFVFCISCTQEINLKEYMVSSWQTDYLKIEMYSHKNSDSLYVFEDNFSGSPAVIARSNYKKDGTFSAWYVTKDNKKESETTGNWFVKGDSLTVSYSAENDKLVTLSYYINLTEKGFTARSKHDWDNDGVKDDILLMKTRKIKLD